MEERRLELILMVWLSIELKQTFSHLANQKQGLHRKGANTGACYSNLKQQAIWWSCHKGIDIMGKQLIEMHQ
jgi:hypothetical protein